VEESASYLKLEGKLFALPHKNDTNNYHITSLIKASNTATESLEHTLSFYAFNCSEWFSRKKVL